MKTMLTQNIIMDNFFFFFSKCLPLKTRRRFEKKRKIIWKLTQFISTGAVAEGEIFYSCELIVIS